MWTVYITAYTVFNANQVGWGTGLWKNADKVLIALATFLILTFTELNPVWLVIAGAILGFLLYR